MKIPFTLIDKTKIDLSDIKGFDTYYNDKKTYLPLIIKLFEEGAYDYLAGQKLNTVVDLGGNVGLFSLFVSPIVKKLYTVEPDPEHFVICQQSLKKIKNIGLYNTAISNKEGTTNFFRSSWNSTCNTIVENNSDSTETVQVQTITLDKLLEKETLIDFVKMDIEGGESVIINDPTFPFNKIKKIEVSVHPVYGVDCNEILSKLKEEGFACTITPSPHSPIILGEK